MRINQIDADRTTGKTQPMPADDSAISSDRAETAAPVASIVEDDTGVTAMERFLGLAGPDATAKPLAAAAPPVLTFGPAPNDGEVGTLGRFRVLKLLGQGGMGAVYLAYDPRSARKIALKVMLPQAAANATAKDRFLREARAAAQIDDDYVVRIYEADEWQGIPFISLQYLEGTPLDQFLQKKGSVTVEQAIRIGMETAKGLDAAHKLGLIHRDIKPANLWLEAPKGRVKILDFGLARQQEEDVHLTQSGAVVGTPAYMSPEQARAEKIDHRTDLFSLGSVLYRLTTGAMPFKGSTTMAMLTSLGCDEPTPVRALNPKVPEALANLIQRLLAKKVEQRPKSAAEVVKLLQEIQRGGGPATAALAQKVEYAPLAVSGVTENVWTDIDDENAPLDAATEKVAALHPHARAARKRSPKKLVALGAGLLALIAAVAIIIKITNKDGSVTEIKVPDDSKIEIVRDPKKGNESNPAQKFDADRKAAEWVLSVGGAVRVNAQDDYIKIVSDLPKETFQLTGVYLNEAKQVNDADLARLKDCKNLTYLLLNGPQLSDAGLTNFKDCKSLTALHLGVPHVTSAGLANFKDCKSLTQLALYMCARLTDAGLANFKDCKNLTYLDLYGCTEVSDAGLAHFKDRKDLTYLGLSGCSLVTDVGVANFKGCQAITKLTLQGPTQVGDAGLANFKDCKSLVSLWVTGFPEVTDAGLAYFKDCKELSELVLGCPQISGEGLAHFKDCRKLTSLGLSGKRVTDADLVHLRGLAALGSLNLTGLKITDAGLANLAELTELRRLCLADTLVTGTGFSHLKGLKELTSMEAYNTPLTDAGLEQLKGLGKLTALNVNDTKVSDAGLAHLKECKNLTLLYLQKTKVTVPKIEELKTALPKCRILWDGGVIEPTDVDRKAAEWVLSVGGIVCVNGKHDLGIKAVADLPKETFQLTSLSLHGTNVSDMDLAQLKDCNNLTVLDLYQTQVSDVGMAYFKDWKNLAQLNLTGTQVSAAGMANFKECKNLTQLVLGSPQLSEAALDHFKDCKNLTYIFLSYTKVSDAGMARFKEFKSLKVLLLHVPQVSDAGLAALKDCNSLTTLDLQGTKFSDAGLAHLKDYKNLVQVGLVGTPVSDSGLVHIKDCKNLTSLGLNGTNVTDTGLAHLKDCKSLAVIYLQKTKVTAAGIDELKKALPKCQITWDGGTIEPTKK